MTNRQRYERAFEALHVSEGRLREVYFMKQSKKATRVGRAILIAACIMALLTVSAYAANEATDGWVFGKIVDMVDVVTGRLIPRDEGYQFITEDGRCMTVTVVDAGDSGVLQTYDGDNASVSIRYQLTYPGGK